LALQRIVLFGKGSGLDQQKPDNLYMPPYSLPSTEGFIANHKDDCNRTSAMNKKGDISYSFPPTFLLKVWNPTDKVTN
jgi:hypothetical protein